MDTPGWIDWRPDLASPLWFFPCMSSDHRNWLAPGGLIAWSLCTQLGPQYHACPPPVCTSLPSGQWQGGVQLGCLECLPCTGCPGPVTPLSLRLAVFRGVRSALKSGFWSHWAGHPLSEALWCLLRWAAWAGSGLLSFPLLYFVFSRPLLFSASPGITFRQIFLCLLLSPGRPGPHRAARSSTALPGPCWAAPCACQPCGSF